MENSLISTVIENMEGEIPQCMYENKINEMVNDFSYRLQSQGMNLDLYLHYTGSDMKTFRATFRNLLKDRSRSDWLWRRLLRLSS